MSHPPPYTVRMKNIINDQKRARTEVAANINSLPANQKSRRQDQLGRQDHLGLKIPKPVPLSLIPLARPAWSFSKVDQPLTGSSTVSTVSFHLRELRFEISNLKSAIPHDLAPHDPALSGYCSSFCPHLFASVLLCRLRFSPQIAQ